MQSGCPSDPLQARALPKRGQGPAWSEDVEARHRPDATSGCVARSLTGKGSRLPQSSAAILAALVQTSLRDACICILVDERLVAEDVSDALDELLAHAEHPVFVMRYCKLCFHAQNHQKPFPSNDPKPKTLNPKPQNLVWLCPSCESVNHRKLQDGTKTISFLNEARATLSQLDALRGHSMRGADCLVSENAMNFFDTKNCQILSAYCICLGSMQAFFRSVEFLVHGRRRCWVHVVRQPCRRTGQRQRQQRSLAEPAWSRAQSGETAHDGHAWCLHPSSSLKQPAYVLGGLSSDPKRLR